MKFCLKIVCLALFCACGLGWGSQDTLTVSADGVQSPVGVWWPQDKGKTSMKKAAGSKVAVWFHGGMTSGNCSKGLVAGDDFAKLFQDRIVISVSACRQNHWATPQMMKIVDVALDSVAARRKAVIPQVDLVGISDGALGVIVYSMEGRRNVNHRLLMSSFGGSLGPASELGNLLRAKSGRWLFLQGGADRLYPSGQSVPWIEDFCKNVGAECNLKYDPSGEHDWLYWKERRLEWIKQGIL